MLIYHRTIHSHSRVVNVKREAFGPQHRDVHIYAQPGSIRAGLFRIKSTSKASKDYNQPNPAPSIPARSFHSKRSRGILAVTASNSSSRCCTSRQRTSVKLLATIAAAVIPADNTVALRTESRTPIERWLPSILSAPETHRLYLLPTAVGLIESARHTSAPPT